MFPMRTAVISVALLVALLAGCAARKPKTLVIAVTDDSYILQTADAKHLVTITQLDDLQSTLRKPEIARHIANSTVVVRCSPDPNDAPETISPNARALELSARLINIGITKVEFEYITDSSDGKQAIVPDAASRRRRVAGTIS